MVDYHRSSLSNLDIPPEVKERQKILEFLTTEMKRPEGSALEQELEIALYVFENNTLKILRRGKDKAKVYVPQFLFEHFEKSHLKQFKKDGVSMISVYVKSNNVYIPFRSRKYEDLKFFTRIGDNDLGMMVCLVALLLTLILFVFPQIF